MTDSDETTIRRVMGCALFGAFAGMALAGGILWLDVSSLRTLFERSEGLLLSNIFLGGLMLKGGVVGFGLGCASLAFKVPSLHPSHAPQNAHHLATSRLSN